MIGKKKTKIKAKKKEPEEQEQLSIFKQAREIFPEEEEVVELPIKEVMEESLSITAVFPSPISTWFKGIPLNVCSICGRKDFYFYEIVSVKGGDKFQVACGKCLAEAGYSRKLVRNDWQWFKRNIPVRNR